MLTATAAAAGVVAAAAGVVASLRADPKLPKVRHMDLNERPRV